MEQTLIRLQTDAIARGMQELAIVYGWSIMRINCEHMCASIPTLKLLGKSNG